MRMSLKEKVGQLLMFAFHGEEINDQLKTLITELNVGGVIHFSRNITSVNQVTKLNNDLQLLAKTPLFISLDEEGGTVQRIINGITPFPGAMALSATNESNYTICKTIGNELKDMGFNMNFAPVADINNNPINPVINSRSYGDNPSIVTKYVIDAVNGFQDAHIISTVKHFPGHGDTIVDSHLSLPKVDKSIKELTNNEIYPFMKAIEAGCDGIMASHIIYPVFDNKYPASLSYKIIHDLLRDKLNYQGLVVTDSLTMGAIGKNFTDREVVINCVNAGVDVMIFCGSAEIEKQKEIYHILLEEVEKGNIPLSRIDESLERIIRFKEKYGILKSDYNNTQKGFSPNVCLGKYLSQKSITKVFDNNLLPLKRNIKTLVIFPEIKIFSLVDNINNDIISLGKVLKEKGFDNEELIINTQTDINNLPSFDSYEQIIFATYNVRESDYQVKIYELLNKDKTVVVSMRSPYDYLFLKGLRTYICIYEATRLALESLSNCLLGYSDFRGKLPIRITRGV